MNIYNALNLKKGVQLFDNNERYFFYSWNYGIKDIPRMKVTLNIRNYPQLLSLRKFDLLLGYS